MGYKILTSTASADSAMKFRDSLCQILGLGEKGILVSKDSGNCKEHKVLARYGCSYGELFPEPEWNSKDFIKLCIDKLQFSSTFKGVVDVPQFYNNSFPKEYSVLIRETLTGKESSGIHVVHNEAEFLSNWTPGFYWTPFFVSEFEVRVLVAFNEKEYHARIYKKEPSDGTVRGDDFVVTSENVTWRLKKVTNFPKVISTVERMLPKMHENGGRFAGIDMIYVPSLGRYVVLEINSGPWLAKGAAEWLANIFVEWQWKNFK